jgi:small subunit ribosomal protein S6
MPVQLYECMLMLDTTKVAGDLQTVVNQIQATYEKHKAEVMASRPWDERKLAYPVRKQKKALFYLTYFKADTQAVKAIEHDLTLNEAVLRYMVLRVEPKLSETMLALARDPHALALQTANEEMVDEFEMPSGRR